MTTQVSTRNKARVRAWAERAARNGADVVPAEIGRALGMQARTAAEALRQLGYTPEGRGKGTRWLPPPQEGGAA